VILHSSPVDVDTVIVEDTVRKRDGKLLNVTLDDGDKTKAGAEMATWAWKDVAAEVLKRQKIMDQRIKKVDLVEAQDPLIEAWYLDRSTALADTY